MASARNLLSCFFNCKIVTGHKVSTFKKIITQSQCARAKRGFHTFVLVRRYGRIILINFNVKVIFYMF